MATLTKKQRRAIETALDYARIAQQYLDDPELVVARRDRIATTTLHYLRADGALYEVNKQCGSRLVNLRNCIDTLKKLLAPASEVDSSG